MNCKHPHYENIPNNCTLSMIQGWFVSRWDMRRRRAPSVLGKVTLAKKPKPIAVVGYTV